MPVHDWAGVEAGIFQDFQHSWIHEIHRALNSDVLPRDYYGMVEQLSVAFAPTELASKRELPVEDDEPPRANLDGDGGLLLAPPKQPITAETDLEFYRRKQNDVVVRHVSGDRIVAIVEIVSPGNKSSQRAMRAFVDKAAQFLEQQVHLLIVDVHRPGPRDPAGIHGAIWENMTGEEYRVHRDKPLTTASYEADLGIRCIVEHVAVGEELPDMPLFLKRNGQVPVPLERTYEAAFQALPQRWRRVLEGK